DGGAGRALQGRERDVAGGRLAADLLVARLVGRDLALLCLARERDREGQRATGEPAADLGGIAPELGDLRGGRTLGAGHDLIAAARLAADLGRGRCAAREGD